MPAICIIEVSKRFAVGSSSRLARSPGAADLDVENQVLWTPGDIDADPGILLAKREKTPANTNRANIVCRFELIFSELDGAGASKSGYGPAVANTIAAFDFGSSPLARAVRRPSRSSLIPSVSGKRRAEKPPSPGCVDTATAFCTIQRHRYPALCQFTSDRRWVKMWRCHTR